MEGTAVPGRLTPPSPARLVWRTARILETRDEPPHWSGYHRRIDRAMLEEVAGPPEGAPLIHVCGPTSMVEAVATHLVDVGHPPVAIRTERFGPSAPV